MSTNLDPTPSAPSLQSVAEGSDNLTANIARIIWGLGIRGDQYLSAVKAVRELITTHTDHFAPLLAERDERIGRLEKERDELLACLTVKPFGDCENTFQFNPQDRRIYVYDSLGGFLWSGTPTWNANRCVQLNDELSALRTRCEELEKCFAELESRGIWDAQSDTKVWRFVLRGHPGTESTLRMDLPSAIRAAKESKK